MLGRVAEEFAESRPLFNDIPGTHLFFSGLDHWPELDILHSANVEDVVVPFQLLRTRVDDEEFLSDHLSHFNTVVLDSNSVQMEKNAASEGGFKQQCAEYLMTYKNLASLFTFGLAPYRAIDILGLDFYLDFLDEIDFLQLPIFPVIDRWEPWVEEKVFKRHKYVAVTSEIAHNPKILKSVFESAKPNNVVILAQGLEERYLISRFPFYGVLNSAWKNGTKWNVTFIFDGEKLLSFPAKNAKSIREKYKELLVSQGVDFEQVISGVHWAVDKMNAIAWSKYGEIIGKETGKAYWLTSIERAEANQALVALTSNPGETSLQLVNDTVKLIREDDGRTIWGHIEVEEEKERSFFDARMVMVAKCDDCVVAVSCPMFRPNSRCAFKSTAPLNGMEDLKRMLSAVLAIQNDRVQFGSLVDRLEGNKLSPEVSKEIQSLVKNSELFWKMFKSAPVGSDDDDSLNISLKGGIKGKRTFVQAFIEEDNGRERNSLKSMEERTSQQTLLTTGSGVEEDEEE